MMLARDACMGYSLRAPRIVASPKGVVRWVIV
jgi:hypothetical protein